MNEGSRRKKQNRYRVHTTESANTARQKHDFFSRPSSSRWEIFRFFFGFFFVFYLRIQYFVFDVLSRFGKCILNVEHKSGTHRKLACFSPSARAIFFLRRLQTTATTR